MWQSILYLSKNVSGDLQVDLFDSLVVLKTSLSDRGHFLISNTEDTSQP